MTTIILKLIFLCTFYVLSDGTIECRCEPEPNPQVTQSEPLDESDTLRIVQ